MNNGYFSAIQNLFTKVNEKNKQVMQQSASILAECFERDGILHVFGCGHSHMIAEEVFYRAGGIVPVRPVLIEDVMLHKGALRSSEMERDPCFADTFLPLQPFEPNDALLVVSTSGRNPVPIEVAQYGKEIGMKVITISSHAYHSLSTRHSSGIFLSETATIAIDSCIPQGDALVTIEGLETPIGPGSTIINAAIVNDLIIKTTEILHKNGIAVPIFKSGNIDGAEEHNERAMRKYRDRIGMF
ncbi:SIS domain-containing protein [Sutcliffiella horikoshii]|uniref:SIS domain-containing protein n=1 Tax=Sutcliffiella horikoshii TaxID=79883 RepID=UPI001F168B0B|nr:SIS domain-containing protein [Sutcliffiella horikoshii]MCG1020412.1 sugar isomerase domain-containing protein [Sutcliffiella horikoshii]